MDYLIWGSSHPCDGYLTSFYLRGGTDLERGFSAWLQVRITRGLIKKHSYPDPTPDDLNQSLDRETGHECDFKCSR